MGVWVCVCGCVGCVGVLMCWVCECVGCSCFVGEAHLLLHAEDFAIDAFMLSPAESASLPVAAPSGSAPSVLHTVLCQRCACPLGVAWCPVGSTRPDDDALRVYKDRIAMAAVGTVQPALHALSRYSVCSRVWVDLVDRAAAHSQYRFTLHSVDRVDSTGPRTGAFAVSKSLAEVAELQLEWTDRVWVGVCALQGRLQALASVLVSSY